MDAVPQSSSPGAQTTGLLTFFLPDSQPLSLEASVVAVNTVESTPTAGGPFTVPVTTLQLACPTAASPDNDACRSAGIYPAQVQHTQGSVFGGTTTHSADDSTTTWICALGNSGPSFSADCTKTIISNSGSETQSTTFGNCYVGAHQRPVVVTAGVDKVSRAHYLTGDASQYLSVQSSQLSAEGCPASETVIWAGESGTASATWTPTAPFRASAAATTQSGSTTSTGASQTSSGSGSASSAAASSAVPKGAARGGMSWSAGLVVGLGVISAFGWVL